VTPGYFKALGMRVIRGRDMLWTDDPPTMLASESAARRLWPGEDPIGKRVAFGGTDMVGFEVVGVVADTRMRGLTNEAPAMMYLAYEGGISILRTMSLVVRGSADDATTLATVKDVLREMDPALPVYDVRPVPELISESIAQPRLNTSLLTVFAAIALLLAGIGIYGVVSYAVAQRAQEIGVRMALGAKTSDVFGLVLREGALLAIGGAAVGIGAAYALTPLVRRWIYGVGAIDPATLGATVAALVAVALAACYVPALRAMRVDPVSAMRAE
jgi:putative ABC transport system permease protein